MLPSGMPSWMVYKSSPSSRILLLWNLIVLFGIVSYLGSPQGRCLLCSVLVLTPLPMPLNLARWKIQSNPRCPLCSVRNPTTLHILNGCVSALNQGRYTWRHDSVLSCIASWLTPTLGEDKCMYADLPGHRASDSPSSSY